MTKSKGTIRTLALMGLLTFGVVQIPLMAQQRPKAEKLDPTALKALQLKVEKNQDSINYHKQFIHEFDLEQPQILAIYDVWIKDNPKNANIPFALGTALANAYSPKAKDYLLQAVALNPKLKDAYGSLWMDAERWGDENLGRKYLRKAVEIDPNDPNYSFYYASSFKKIDKAKYKERSLAVADKFKTSERGAQALYWLAVDAKDPVEKEEIYKKLKNEFSPKDFNWSSSGMSSYNDFLIGQQRFADAEALCNELFKLTAKENWQTGAATAASFATYKRANDNKEWDKALAILNDLKIASYSPVAKRIPIFKAEIQAKKGEHQAAYQTLMDYYAKSPSPVLKDELKKQGKTLGKSDNAVQQDIGQMLKNKAQVATAFDLKNYSGGKNSLKDFEGKVAFITYWYPGCGPCRGEFPHFENVVKKFDKDQLAYIGINIAPTQNDYVLPFMKSTGYSFLPLEDFKGREKGNLDNKNAAPMNFMIDKKGNLVFSNFRTDAHNEDELELMINEVLAL